MSTYAYNLSCHLILWYSFTYKLLVKQLHKLYQTDLNVKATQKSTSAIHPISTECGPVARRPTNQRHTRGVSLRVRYRGDVTTPAVGPTP